MLYLIITSISKNETMINVQQNRRRNLKLRSENFDVLFNLTDGLVPYQFHLWKSPSGIAAPKC